MAGRGWERTKKSPGIRQGLLMQNVLIGLLLDTLDYV
jgi:hypothetical protein